MRARNQVVGKGKQRNPQIPSKGAQGSKSKPTKVPGIKYVLEQFTDVDLRRWQKTDRSLSEYNIRFFYHLEGQRASKRHDLLEALQTVKPVECNIDQWFRMVSYKYSLNPLSSRGSLSLHGGRFNYGVDLDCASLTHFNALYIASSQETAYIERLGPKRKGKLSRFDMALQKEESFSTFILEGHVYNLFDLTNANNLKSFIKVTNTFGISPEIRQMAIDLTIDKPQMIRKPRELREHLMAANWRYWPMQFDVPYNSQVFGELLLRAGFDGVLYKSQYGTGKCMAIFPENLNNSDSYVHILGDPPSDTVITSLNAETWEKLI